MKAKPLKQASIPAIDEMLHPTAKARQAKRQREKKAAKKVQMTGVEFQELGIGKIAYIKKMSAKMAAQMYPAAKALPQVGEVFALYTAKGSPLALTDSHDLALGHAIGDKLNVCSLH